MGETRVVDLLGGAGGLGVERGLDFDREIKRGFRPQVIARFKSRTHFSTAALSRVLGVSARTIDRALTRKGGARLKPAVSDRLYRVARIVTLAEEVFEDRVQAFEWLSARQAGVGNRVPMELLETEAGTRDVEDELLRIEHGFVA